MDSWPREYVKINLYSLKPPGVCYWSHRKWTQSLNALPWLALSGPCTPPSPRLNPTASPSQLLWSATQPCPSKAGISYPRIQFLSPLISLLGRTDLHHPEDLQRCGLHPEGVFSLQVHFKETIKSPMRCCALTFAVSLSLITDTLSPDVACELCVRSTCRLWAGRSLSEGTVDMFLARCIIFTTLLGKIFVQPSYILGFTVLLTFQSWKRC